MDLIPEVGAGTGVRAQEGGGIQKPPRIGLAGRAEVVQGEEASDAVTDREPVLERVDIDLPAVRHDAEHLGGGDLGEKPLRSGEPRGIAAQQRHIAGVTGLAEGLVLVQQVVGLEHVFQCLLRW